MIQLIKSHGPSCPSNTICIATTPCPSDHNGSTLSCIPTDSISLLLIATIAVRSLNCLEEGIAWNFLLRSFPCLGSAHRVFIIKIPIQLPLEIVCVTRIHFVSTDVHLEGADRRGRIYSAAFLYSVSAANVSVRSCDI